jgi:hypothetical protein
MTKWTFSEELEQYWDEEPDRELRDGQDWEPTVSDTTLNKFLTAVRKLDSQRPNYKAVQAAVVGLSSSEFQTVCQAMPPHLLRRFEEEVLNENDARNARVAWKRQVAEIRRDVHPNTSRRAKLKGKEKAALTAAAVMSGLGIAAATVSVTPAAVAIAAYCAHSLLVRKNRFGELFSTALADAVDVASRSVAGMGRIAAAETKNVFYVARRATVEAKDRRAHRKYHELR